MDADTTSMGADTTAVPTPSDTLSQQGADTSAGAWSDTTSATPTDTTQQ
jgi:hypothetical protein